MAKFLNTNQLSEWILKLINSSEEDLIIIVPFLQTSEKIYNNLLEANNRGVQITLIYKENKLNDKEKAKLYALDNLNLMSHPNVHAKCYYNQDNLIICSMNLYEYSEKNNREMGILLNRAWLEEDSTGYTDIDSEVIFTDAIDEIRNIINGSTLERKSIKSVSGEFEISIVKTEKEKQEELCKTLNKVFVHKKFEPCLIGEEWSSVCKNYFDKIDVNFGYRIELAFTFEPSRVETIFRKYMPYHNETKFNGFKVYWNGYNKNMFLYRDSRDKTWDNISEEETITRIKGGLDNLIRYIRQFF